MSLRLVGRESSIPFFENLMCKESSGSNFASWAKVEAKEKRGHGDPLHIAIASSILS